MVAIAGIVGCISCINIQIIIIIFLYIARAFYEYLYLLGSFKVLYLRKCISPTFLENKKYQTTTFSTLSCLHFLLFVPQCRWIIAGLVKGCVRNQVLGNYRTC